MKEKLLNFLYSLGSKVLYKLNLTDHGNHKLSITNIAVIVCITKIALSPVISITEIGALLLSLLNYAHKRGESNKVVKAEKNKLPDSEHILGLVKDLSQKLENQVKANEEQAKISEEVKSFMVGTRLNASQKRHQL